MLVREGADRNDRIDTSLAVSLALVAGALNAAAFYAVGFFAANMTGNVSTASDYLVLGSWSAMLLCTVLVVAFVAGSCVSALFISARARVGSPHAYGHALLIEAALLAALGVAAPRVPEGAQTASVIVSLAFLMGFQNAVVTRISGARVRTTHISGMATDLGIEIAGMWGTRRNRGERRSDILRQLKLHAATIASFFAGGVLGVLVYREVGNAIYLFAGGVVAAIAVVGMAGARR